MLTDTKIYAITNGSMPPFGTQDYFLLEDKGSSQIALHLNACDDLNEYNCEDGSCIPIEMRCDSKLDCIDGSDEKTCHMIEVPNNYLRHVPAGLGNNYRSTVTANVNVSKVLSVLEGSELFSVAFILTIVWQDGRLTYRNLKKDSIMNIVSNSEGKLIWYPVVVFHNTRDKDKSLVCP